MRGTAWNHWNWLEKLVVPVASAAMYATWVTPFINRLLAGAIIYPKGLALPWWLTVALLLTANGLSLFFQGRRYGRWLLAAIGLAILPLALGVSGAGGQIATSLFWRTFFDWDQGIPGYLLILLVTAGLWFYGARIDWLDHEQYSRGFIAGIIVLGGFSAIVPGAVPAEDLVLFLLIGLFALALLTVARHLSYQEIRGLRRPPLSRYWLAAMLLAMIGIMLAGWLLSMLLAPEAVAALLRRLRPIRDAISLAIAYLGVGVFYLLYAFYRFLMHLFLKESAPTPDAEKTLPRSYVEQLEELNISPGTERLPEGFLIALGIFVVAGLVAVALLLAWRRRSRTRRISLAEEEREFIWNTDLALERWRGLFKHSRRRRKRLFAETLRPDSVRNRIRGAYRAFLLSARERGLPRLPSQTVTAYRDVVVQEIPPVEPSATVLTEAYLEARYSPIEPSEELAQQAQEASQAVVILLAAEKERR